MIELRSAVTALLADYRACVILLTDEVYDLGLPSWRRMDTGTPGGRS